MGVGRSVFVVVRGGVEGTEFCAGVGAAVVEAAAGPLEELAEFGVFEPEVFCGVPVSGTETRDAEPLRAHSGLEGFELAGGHFGDFVAWAEFVELVEGESVGADTDAEFRAELAEFVGDFAVADGGGDDEFGAMGPAGVAEGLEEVGAAAIEGDLDAEACADDGEWGEAEGGAEPEGGRADAGLGRGEAAAFPVDDGGVGAFPDIAEGGAWGEGGFEEEGEAACGFVVAGEDGAEFLFAGDGEVEGVGVCFEEHAEAGLGHGDLGGGADDVSAEVVALALFDFGDGAAGIAAHDGEVVAEGGVAVFVAEAEADEADEFGAFDGFCRVGWQDFRQDVLQVVPEIHGSEVGLKRMGGSR